MSLKSVVKNHNELLKLNNILEGKKVSHAYILQCDDKDYGEEVAINFAKSVVCKEVLEDCCDGCLSCKKIDHNNYEDLKVLKDEKIKVDNYEEAVDHLKYKPLSGEINILIIKNADNMNATVQNKILKTLEEPSSKSLIILISENVENLLITIRSRCVILKIESYRLFLDENITEEATELMILLIKKRNYYEILENINKYIDNKEEILSVLEILESMARDILVMASSFNKIDLNLSEENRLKFKELGRLRRNEYFLLLVKLIENAKQELKLGYNYKFTFKKMIVESLKI